MMVLRSARRMLAALTISAVAGPAAAQYLLQPGDSVRMSIAGLPDVSVEAMVGPEGRMRLPQFGSIEAADRTIEALEEALRQRVAGQVYKRYAPDGTPLFIAIDPLDVTLDVALLRPVYVSGDVAQPGAVPFRPGLTVRAAIASTGGVRATGSLRPTDDPARDVARLQGDYRVLQLEAANLRARIWRARAELALDPDAPPPSAAALGVDEALRAEILAPVSAELDTALAAAEGQRRFLRTAIGQAEERLAILRKQSENQAVAVEDDEAELGRVVQLFERGVVPIARLLDIRRAQLASSTRLLQTDDGLARVTLERTRFEREIDSTEESRETRLIQEIADSQRRLREVGVRLAATRAQIEILGATPLGLVEAAIETHIALFRGIGAAAVETVAEIDALLAPGDVIEVTVTQNLPAQDAASFSGG